MVHKENEKVVAIGSFSPIHLLENSVKSTLQCLGCLKGARTVQYRGWQTPHHGSFAALKDPQFGLPGAPVSSEPLAFQTIGAPI